MAGYILSILGIVVAGIIIDIIVPSGNINKYIKSVYAIFVVAVLISPIVNFLNKNQGFNFKYDNYEISAELLNFINQTKVDELEKNIQKELETNGFSNIDIKIEYNVENTDLILKNCIVNLKNLAISPDKLNINKYEFIREVVKKFTNLTDEVIVFNE